MLFTGPISTIKVPSVTHFFSTVRDFLGLRSPKSRDQDEHPFFVDIHSHIIPAIDDGPSTIEDVVEMLRRAHATGTREVVATPHMFLDLFDNFDAQAVKESFRKTVSELEERSALPESGFLAEMTFYRGAENFICREFLDALEAQRVLTINDSRYILVEAPPYLSAIQMRFAVDQVIAANLSPIIAHPERYLAFQERPKRLGEFLEKGCIIQVNGGSVLGIYGRKAKKAARTFLREDLVHIIASDNHGSAVRPVDLGSVYSSLAGRFKSTKLKLWLSANPSSIVRNDPLVSQ
jgi:protein-tyrosine phosphatase